MRIGSGAASADVVAITGATVIDGTGGSPLESAVVLVDGSRIAAIGEAMT